MGTPINQTKRLHLPHRFPKHAHRAMTMMLLLFACYTTNKSIPSSLGPQTRLNKHPDGGGGGTDTNNEVNRITAVPIPRRGSPDPRTRKTAIPPTSVFEAPPYSQGRLRLAGPSWNVVSKLPFRNRFSALTPPGILGNRRKCRRT